MAAPAPPTAGAALGGGALGPRALAAAGLALLGLLLIVGLGTRVVAALSAVLFLAFIVGIASAWARGLQIDCGCFGGGGFRADATAQYPWEIARDVGLLLMSAYLVWQGRTRLALDNLLFPRHDDADLELENLDNQHSGV